MNLSLSSLGPMVPMDSNGTGLLKREDGRGLRPSEAPMAEMAAVGDVVMVVEGDVGRFATAVDPSRRR